MTVNELIAQLQQLAKDGHGETVVCLPDWELTADSSDMFPINGVAIKPFHSPAASEDVAEGVDAVLLS